MTDITHEEVRDSIPELLHGKLDAEHRSAVEAHLRSCAQCASEMRILQMVKETPSFAPMIDAVKIASVIPPYGGIPVERPRTTTRIWQMTLAAAAVVLIAVTVMSRGASNPVSVPSAPTQVVATQGNQPSPSAATATVAPTPTKTSEQTAKPTRELQVAVGLDGLSDGSIAQLVNELDGLDGLPSGEPENLGVGDPTGSGGSGQ